jgi:hypothetical protein
VQFVTVHKYIFKNSVFFNVFDFNLIQRQLYKYFCPDKNPIFEKILTIIGGLSERLCHTCPN